MANEFDYSKWGAADWRKFLPADLGFGGQLVVDGNGLAYYNPSIPQTFSKNGYEFAVDPVSKYVTQIKKDGQRLNIVGGAEHTRYTGAGLLDPRLNEALTNWKNTPDKLDDYLASMDPITAAGLLGTINDRGTVAWGSADATAFRPETYWGQLMGDPTAQAWWNSNMTPAAQSAADEGPSFMDDVFTSIIPGVLAMVGGVTAMGGLAGLAGFGGLGGAAAGEVLGAGALAETAGAGALGSGLTAGGGLGLTAGGGTGLAGTISGLGSAAAGGGLTAAGLTGTGLGAGWAGLGAGLTGAAEGALGSGLSAGGNAAGGITGSIDGLGSIGSIGGEGLQGIATGALDGTAGALGSTSGAAGLTGTIEGLGTLTAEGMLIPAAGGAAVPLSSLTSGLPSLSDLKSLLDKAKEVKSLLDKAKEVKSGVSAVTTALGGRATAPKTTKPATVNAGALSGMYPVAQGKSALEAMMSGEDGNSLDEFMRLMAQSGKGA